MEPVEKGTAFFTMMESKLITLSGTLLNRLPYSIRIHLYQLKERYLLQRATEATNHDGVFFIIGSQRSGTTLLGLVLDSHPKIKICDEEFSYDALERGEFETNDMSCGFKIPVWTHRHPYIKKRYPNGKYIFIKRDLNAIVSSMMRLDVGGAPWIEEYGIGDLERTIAEIKNRDLRRALYLRHSFHKKRNDMLMLATICAWVKHYFLFQIQQTESNIMLIEYEKLVKDPVNEIGDLLRFLKLEWDDAILMHHKEKKGMAIGKTDKSRPIDGESIAKWKQHLSADDASRIGAECEYLTTLHPAH